MRQENPAAMLTQRIEGQQVWVRDTLQKSDWFFTLDDACRHELAAVIDDVRANSLLLLFFPPDQ